MAEVEISYKGSNIATMNASGTKTLLTEAKYLEDDVTITYTRPSAPSGTKNISITANGVTTEDVTNYASAQITANVPNTYSAGDEGKVVSNGALVAQGSDTVTQNDTYDTTLISSLTVNVSGGGDGFLIGGQTVRIKNTSASQRLVMRIRNINYGVTHLGAYSANVSAGSTMTSYNYFATFEKNGNKYIAFHTGYNPASITYNGDPVAYVTAGSAAQWDVEVTLPSGFDNSYTLDIG